MTVLAVINPLVCGSIFLTLTPKLPAAQRWQAAVRVSFSVLVILLASAIVGLKVLSIFNISLDVFRVVGGVIIAYMGADMLRGGHTVAQTPPADDDGSASASMAPLVMFAAGPGTITTIVTLAAVHTPDGLPVTAIIAALIGTAATLLALLLAVQLGSRISKGTQAIVTRFMGLIVASMGMQFVLVGTRAFFHA